ncbi:MAG: hypothetical protein P8016_02175 [Sedimentisphaerales bacterium]
MKSQNDIPKFDLAEQIMAEHRKSASVKRKAPSKDGNSDRTSRNSQKSRESDVVNRILDNHSSPIDRNKPAMFHFNTSNTKNDETQIIAEIVKRDILKFLSNHNRRIQ